MTSGGSTFPASHQESHWQCGTEVLRFGRTHKAMSTFGYSKPRDQQELSKMSKWYLKPAAAASSEEKIAF